MKLKFREFLNLLQKRMQRFYWEVGYIGMRWGKAAVSTLLFLMLAGIFLMEFDRYMEWRITHQRTYRCGLPSDDWSLFDLSKMFSSFDCTARTEVEPHPQAVTDTVRKYLEDDDPFMRFSSEPAPLPPLEAR